MASDACTVTQAMNAAKRGLEQIHLSVIGEVSEVSNKPAYKAVYFTVRDDKSAMPCLMWRERFAASGVELQVGMLVELKGFFSCYTAKGRMQFCVEQLAPAGEGKLRMQVAQLARKLEAEGLMDDSRKRGLRALPKRIAVVTSPHGKAVHDVIRTLRRRYPLGEVVVCGVPVEGAGAADHIIEGLECACAADPVPDVILLVRGGGSYEDLMPFNDERLARAVAACPVPVVTGIGHEPDNSICDMVADRRCSTPTAAAEAVALSTKELEGKVANARAALGTAAQRRIDAARHRVGRLADRPVFTDAHYLTGAYSQQLDLASERLMHAIPDALEADAHQLDELTGRLRRALPGQMATYRAELGRQTDALRTVGPTLLTGQDAALRLAAAKLEAFSPLKTLGRGYSITYAADGRTLVDHVDMVADGDRVVVQVQDGILDCTVDAVERK